MPKIRDNQTGQIFEVPESDLGKYGLSPQATQQPTTPKITKEQVTSVLLNPGISEKTKKNFKELYELNKGSAEEAKKSDSYNAVINFIDTLEKNYSAAGGGSFGEGPSARLKGFQTAIAGKLGRNDPANIYERQKKGFAATLKELTGDIGVLTEQDFKRLAGLVPDLGSTPGEAEGLLNDLRGQISAKFGGPKTQTAFKLGQKPAQIVNNQGAATMAEPNVLADLLIPGFANLQRKRNKGEGVNMGDFAAAGGDIASWAIPLGKIGMLGKIANPFLRGATKGALAGGIRGATLPGEQTTEDRVIGGLAGTALGGVLGFGTKIPKAGQNIGIIRDTAIKEAQDKGVTFSGKLIKNAGRAYAQTDIEAKGIASKVLPRIKSNLTPNELMKKIKVWNRAYTGAGKVGNTAKADFYDTLAKSAKAQLQEKAPKVAGANKLFSILYGTGGFLKRAAFPAAISAGVGIGASKLFGGGNR